jgi:L-amino acid N-acyltransferase YncA
VLATALVLRDLRPSDWPEVSRIYAEGIATRNGTFETEVPSWDDWNASHLVFPENLGAWRD